MAPCWKAPTYRARNVGKAQMDGAFRDEKTKLPQHVNPSALPNCRIFYAPGPPRMSEKLGGVLMTRSVTGLWSREPVSWQRAARCRAARPRRGLRAASWSVVSTGGGRRSSGRGRRPRPARASSRPPSGRRRREIAGRRGWREIRAARVSPFRTRGRSRAYDLSAPSGKADGSHLRADSPPPRSGRDRNLSARSPVAPTVRALSTVATLPARWPPASAARRRPAVARRRRAWRGRSCGGRVCSRRRHGSTRRG